MKYNLMFQKLYLIYRLNVLEQTADDFVHHKS